MKAYIFDLDGTLLDSMGVWKKIDIDFLSRRGIIAPKDYTDAVLTMTLPEAAAYTINRFTLTNSADELVQEWHKMAISAYETIAMKPYAKEYLLALKKQGAKLAVATSSSLELFEPALKYHGIYDLFNAICTSDEVGCNKSCPDIFLLAADKLAVNPCDCVVFEDILAAVRSAKSIGMTVYGVYDASSQADWEEIVRLADDVIIDFREMLFSTDNPLHMK